MIFYHSSNFQSKLVIFTYFYNTKIKNIFNDSFRHDIVAIRNWKYNSINLIVGLKNVTDGAKL